MTQEQEFEFRLRLEQEQAAQPTAPAQLPPPIQSKMDRINAFHAGALDGAKNYDATDAVGGQVRGFGSIGATLLAPLDAAARAVNKGQPINIGGYDIVGQDRRTGMDKGLEAAGVNTGSTQFKTNKLIGEVAGTAGVGGALAKGAQFAGASPAIVAGLKSGGLNVGGKTGVPGLLTRGATGATTGGVAAGLVDPGNAAGGALIGGALPVALKASGAAGEALFSGAPSLPVTKQKLDAARRGVETGYVIPPNIVKPNLKNQVIESISGKQATEQVASIRNAAVNEKLVRKSLDLADDAPLNLKTLEDVRDKAGQAYRDIANLPVKPATKGSSLMNQPAQPQIDPKALIEDLKQARNDAQSWFKSYNVSANPEHLASARRADALSASLEKSLENYAMSLGKPGLIPALREARKTIAQTYTVERALNPSTGTIDPKLFARLYEKGKPLSDGLERIGEFASAFPSVSKNPSQIGSAGSHNLKAGLATLLASGGAAAGGPIGVAAGAVPFLAPPVARSIMFAPGAQQRMLNQGLLQPITAAPGGLLEIGQRTAPVLLSQ